MPVEKIGFRLETTIKANGYRVRPDYMHNGVFIEIKVDLNRKGDFEQAKKQLKKYIELKIYEGEKSWVGIATDGIKWIAFIYEKIT